MAGESNDLDKLFESVADGESVDWDALEREAPDDEALAFIRQLRLIAEVAEVHRSQVDEVAPAEDAAQTAPAFGGGVVPIQPSAGRRVWPELNTTSGKTSPGSGPPGSAPAPNFGVWGHLLLVRKIGEGSFGEVYQAHDTWLDHPVALKLVKPEAENRVPPTQLLHEARKLVLVRHVNVVTVHGAARHNGRVGFWMDFIDGETLSARVQQGRLSPGEAVSVGQEVCRALAAVHQAKLIHRDVKAQNVMRAHDGGRIILMDFGAGEFVGDALNPRPQGTPLYLAPEIFRGEGASVRSDIYAAGVLLYYLVTASYPVEGASFEAIRRAHERGERRRLRDERPDLPESFIAIVERAIDPNPAKRYASAGEMEAKLLGEQTDRIQVSVRKTLEPKDTKWTPTQRRLLIVAGGVLAATFVGFLTSFGYYSAIGLTPAFQQESFLTWPIWGIRALLPGAVLVVAVVTAGFVAFTVVYRQILMAIRPTRKVIQPLGDKVGFVVKRVRDAGISTTAPLLLIVQCAFLALAWWWFRELWKGLDALIAHTPGGDLSPLSPSNHTTHQHFRQVFSLELFAFVAAWAGLLRTKYLRREAGSWASTAGGIAVTILTLILLVVPYRILSHNEHERVLYQSQTCYLLAEQGSEALLFCPLQEPPRNRVVKLDDPGLERGGPVEDMFTHPGFPR
jgi:Protein kinase domain